MTFTSRYRTDDTGFLVDKYGTTLYAESNEVRFFSTLKYGVSRYFPAIYGKNKTYSVLT